MKDMSDAEIQQLQTRLRARNPQVVVVPPMARDLIGRGYAWYDDDGALVYTPAPGDDVRVGDERDVVIQQRDESGRLARIWQARVRVQSVTIERRMQEYETADEGIATRRMAVEVIRVAEVRTRYREEANG